MEQLSAVITDIIYRNEENSYTVLEVQSGGETGTVVGSLPPFSPGETVVFEGAWCEHPTYGQQFKAEKFQLKTPSSLRGIERYLSSGLIKGVGAATARMIVEEFGQETLDIMTNHPERLMDISGIGRVRYKQIHESFMEQVTTRRAMVFLQTYGLSPLLSMKIIKQYNDRTEEVLRQNPYRLIDDIDGVGFLTADRIAQSIGVPTQSEFRLQYGLKFVLMEAAANEGHTYLPRETLLRRAQELLNVSIDVLQVQLQSLILSKDLSVCFSDDIEAASLSHFLYTEKEIALRLIKQSHSAYKAIDKTVVKQRIRLFEQNEHITFSARQKEAIELAASSGLLIITGGPGTGKTTIINCIIFVLQNGDQVFLAAPTGRAAKRMTEATGHEAKTIHRLLEFGGEEDQFQHDTDNPLDCSCLIVDEASMIDVYLMRSLLRAVSYETQLIFVGDADQLPSVGPGNVLGDMLKSGVLPSVFLNEIFRQEKESAIVMNAHRINRGQMPVFNQKGSDFFLERKQNGHETAETIVDLCKTRLPAFLKANDAAQQIQVLSPTRKGQCGVDNLNRMLQAALNAPSEKKHEILFGDIVFREGDKVLHKKNNYHLAWIQDDGIEGEGVFNGDIGTVIRVDDTEKTLSVRYDDSRTVEYEYKQLEDLDLAYGLSVHKSQGSEFPAVVMPAVGGPPMLMTRNLFYTAVTRARKLLVMVGFLSGVESMVNNDHITKRYTLLLDHLLSIGATYGAE